MKTQRAKLKKIFAPFILATSLALTGCGSSDDEGAPGAGVGGVGAPIGGPGYCHPLQAQIPFVGEGVYSNSVSIKKGYLQHPMYGYVNYPGRTYIGSKPISGITRTGTGAAGEATISITGIQTGAESADVTGVLNLTSNKLQYIQSKFGGQYYGGGYYGGYQPYPMPQQPQQQLCVSDIAFDLGKVGTDKVFHYVYLMFNNNPQMVDSVYIVAQ